MNTKSIASVILLIVVITGIVFFARTPSTPVVVQPNHLANLYENIEEGFTIEYPEGFILNEDYEYRNLSEGKTIKGVQFKISTSVATGTNLSYDSYVSVEHLATSTSCTAADFLDYRTGTTTMTDMGVTYSIASSSDAAAGNRYEEIVYVFPQSTPCLAVRYFIHYGAYQNYPEGSIREFDKQALLATFDTIRRSLVLKNKNR